MLATTASQGTTEVNGGGMRVATANVNCVDIYYAEQGDGETSLVLVHGSWLSHAGWAGLVEHLSGDFRVVSYDRRGHSRSGRPAGQGNIGEDVGDLGALIESLDLAPAWVVANSFGGGIAFRLAFARPDLVGGIVAHEPALMGLLTDDPSAAPMLSEVGQRVGSVIERIASGDHAGAAEQFVETVALGPGAWATLPEEVRQVFVENAPTFLDEAGDPEGATLDLGRARTLDRPVLLTRGNESPPLFAPIVEKLAAVLPRAEVAVVEGAGHLPHATHADAYAGMIRSFIARAR